MTKLEALQQLAEKVEAGTINPLDSWFERALYNHKDGMESTYLAQDAYKGSLDAALSLHNAVLPGWMWSKTGLGLVRVISEAGGWHSAHVEGSVARSMLLASLRALIAIEQQNRDSGDQL